MRYFCELIATLAIIFVVIVALGDPDILDGWIKRANAVECSAPGEPRE